MRSAPADCRGGARRRTHSGSASAGPPATAERDGGPAHEGECCAGTAGEQRGVGREPAGGETTTSGIRSLTGLR